MTKAGPPWHARRQVPATPSKLFLVWASAWGLGACWSPQAVTAPPAESSILLFFQNRVFQGVSQGQTDLRATVAPPALLLGYDQSALELGIPEGPLVLVPEGETLPTPRWAYALDESGWRDTTRELQDENLFKLARVQPRSICACGYEGGCFNDGDPPACQPCPDPVPPLPPRGLNRAASASCPAAWDATVVPGGHFELCVPPTISCPTGLTTASGCQALILDCPDGFPPGEHDFFVRPGSNGVGSRSAPFGDLQAARAALGDTPGQIALAPGEYQLPGPLVGSALTLRACDPNQTRLGDLEVRSELRLEGVGFTALTGRGASIQLERSQGGALDLNAQSSLIANHVELGALAVRSSTASGSGWRVRGAVLLAGGSLRVDDLLAGALNVNSGSAALTAVVIDGGLQVTNTGRLSLAHGRISGRPGVSLNLAGSVELEDAMLRTSGATISVSRGDALFRRTWFVGPVAVTGIDSVMEHVVFEVEAPPRGEPLRYFHLRADQQMDLQDVYARGPSQAGLAFVSGASHLSRAWLQNYGGSVLSLSGSGQLELEDLRAEAEGEDVACWVISVTSAVLSGRRLALATSGVGLLAQVSGELLAQDVRLEQRGLPSEDCRRPFLPLSSEGVGAAAYDRSRLVLERFEILGFPRGVVLNASDGALAQGRLSTPIAFSISEEITKELGLLKGVQVQGADEVCEAVAQ